MSHGRIAKTRSMIYWKTNLKWTLETLSSNKHIEPGRKTRIDRVAQFSFYKDKMNILKNCKKLKNTRFSIFEDFSRETAAIRKEKWQEVLANREKGMISYLNYRTVICKQRVRQFVFSFFFFFFSYQTQLFYLLLFNLTLKMR